MKTYIYFVRHAISHFSLGNERERGLSAQGMHDALKVAQLLIGENIDVIASSTYTRAIETVKPLANESNLAILEFDELRERPIASLRYEVAEAELVAAMDKSYVDLDYCLAEGETTREAQNRAIPVLKKLLSEYQGRKIVIGTHGNIMSIILNYFDKKYGMDFWKQTTKPDIYQLEFEAEQLVNVVRLWKPEEAKD